ncbi:ABC transporter permease [Prolixibacteraceae bacterium JC049]|nr:ABC transporter permease [Prolixibacteraceae bacterium JC049]
MKHYFITIWASLKKSKQTTFFNLVGLSVSFAAFILLSIYLWNEFTFDRYNKNIDRIYLLEMNAVQEGENNASYWLPNPMADYFANNIPEMATVCSFAWGPQTYSLKKNDSQGVNISTRAVDSTFVEVFDLKMKYGKRKTLALKNTVILSDKSAEKLFGDVNPVGKTIYGNFSQPYTVEGVFFELPQNSRMHRFGALCSYPTTSWINDWSEYSFNHYYMLPEGSNVEDIVAKMNASQGVKDWKEGSLEDFSFNLIPANNLHFHKKMGRGNLLFARSLILVAALLLFMAIVNYLNFAVANAPKLRKSVNVRQVLGESKARLMGLAITESIVLITAAFTVSLFFVISILHLWPNMFSYTFILGNYVWLIGLCWLLFAVLGALVSIFPTRINISVKPAQALAGFIPLSPQRSKMGKGLTVLQFGISILLIIGVLFIEKQVNFFKNYDLGFQKENIVTVRMPGSIQKQEQAFINELTKNGNVIDYAFSQFVPGGVGMGWGRNIDGKKVNFKCWPVDERYMKFMGFDIVEGRDFAENIEADENKFIMNQAALKEFGWDKDYLGKQIPGFGFKGELVGIVKDMKYASLHEEVKPLAFWLTKTRHHQLSIKISGQNVKETMAHITHVYSQFEKKFPISYSFLDEELDYMYRAEEKQAQLISIFCLISVIISIVGVLGLAILLSEYRIKEIGVRKVNGARIIEIVTMLNSGFMKSVALAFVIACPLGYWAMNSWMSNFAYRTNMSWWVFALAGFIAFIIAVISISFQSYKAAARNPVEALRYE